MTSSPVIISFPHLIPRTESGRIYFHSDASSGSNYKSEFFFGVFFGGYTTQLKEFVADCLFAGMKLLTHHFDIRFPDPTPVPACFPFSLFQIKPVELMSYMKHLSKKKQGIIRRDEVKYYF